MGITTRRYPTVICRPHDIIFVMSFHFPKAKLGECNNICKKAGLGRESSCSCCSGPELPQALSWSVHNVLLLLSSGELTSLALPQRVTCTRTCTWIIATCWGGMCLRCCHEYEGPSLASTIQLQHAASIC